MTLTRNLFLLFSITIFALASTVLAIFNYNPYQSSMGAMTNFYGSVFVSIFGISAIFIYWTRVRASKNETIYLFLWPSVRQAMLLSIGLTTLLLLRGMRILDWLTGISIVLITILLELFFQTKKPKAK